MASKSEETEAKGVSDSLRYCMALNTALNDDSAFHYPRGATKILDFLFLGSLTEAEDLTFIKCNNITHVINCARGWIDTGPSFYGDDVKYLEFEAEDDGKYDMMQHFDEAYAFIEDARTSGGRALIHCMMGVNRSGVLAAAYVMRHKNISPIDAATKIKQSRGCILTNESFQKQLINYALQNGFLPKGNI